MLCFWPMLQCESNNMFCVSSSCLSLSAMKKIKCFKTIHLWRNYVASNNETYWQLYVKCQTVLSDFHQTWILSTHIHKSPYYQISRISVQREASCGQTDRLTDKMKIQNAFCDLCGCAYKRGIWMFTTCHQNAGEAHNVGW